VHDDTFVSLFRQFWWLIFPLWWMVLRVVRTFRQQSAQDRALEVLRIYAAQGKEPPPEVLKALTQTRAHEDDYGDGVTSGPLYQSHAANSATSAWWTFFVFAALAGGFGYGALYFFTDDARGAFTIVAVIMGVLAAGSLIMALAATFRGPR